MLDSWWNALYLELRVFYGIGILALFVLLIQLVLSVVGGIDDVGDIGDAGDHGSGLSIFSVRGITAFFVGFGWAGVIALKAGLSLLPAILIGIAVGGAMMVGIFGLMTGMLRLQSSGTLNYNNAVGQIGTVYVTVPAGHRPGGQVELLLQGRLLMAEAISRGSEPLAPGTKVKVVEKIGHATLLVEPLSS